MKKKNLLAFGAIGLAIGLLAVFLSIQRDEEVTEIFGVGGGIISLRTAATRYLMDYGETPESISEMREYFADTESYEQQETFFDAVEGKRIEFIYRKTGKETFWVGTPWIVRGNKEYRFYSTEIGGVIEGKSRRK